MSLRDFVIQTKAIRSLNGSSFSVRGLSLNDITLLLQTSEPEVRSMFAIFLGVDKTASESDMLQTAVPALQQFPRLASTMIAIAADDCSVETLEIVQRLPMNTQVEALETILKLSFDAEGGPGKFLEIVTRAFQGMTALTKPLAVSKKR